MVYLQVRGLGGLFVVYNLVVSQNVGKTITSDFLLLYKHKGWCWYVSVCFNKYIHFSELKVKCDAVFLLFCFLMLWHLWSMIPWKAQRVSMEEKWRQRFEFIWQIPLLLILHDSRKCRFIEIPMPLTRHDQRNINWTCSGQLDEERNCVVAIPCHSKPAQGSTVQHLSTAAILANIHTEHKLYTHFFYIACYLSPLNLIKGETWTIKCLLAFVTNKQINLWYNILEK